MTVLMYILIIIKLETIVLQIAASFLGYSLQWLIRNCINLICFRRKHFLICFSSDRVFVPIQTKKCNFFFWVQLEGNYVFCLTLIVHHMVKKETISKIDLHTSHTPMPGFISEFLILELYSLVYIYFLHQTQKILSLHQTT